MMKLIRIPFLQNAKRCFSQTSINCNVAHATTKSLVHLNQRTLLQVSGDEVTDFLQGLITNDMKHLKEGAMSIYSVFLNNKGRVLYDTIIYKAQEDGIYYVECDKSIVNNLLKHLKIYKLRRKVEISTMEDKMKVWTVYDSNITFQSENEESEKKSNLEGKIFPCGTNGNQSSKIIENISIYSDPRIFELGLRILAESNITHNTIIKHLEPTIAIQENESSYKAFRYKLGVGEGVDDLQIGQAFPLEINCDYLHGVSFHKGCYIGQELTARTHHTGVVRKRLMPVTKNDHEKKLEYDEKIINEAGKVVGKVKGHEGKFALGLIRIAEALASKTLTAGDCVLKVMKPHWWPQESQKVEASLKSSKN